MSNEALLAAAPDAEQEHLSSQDIMLHINDTQRERFVKLQETFESDGWRLIVEWCDMKAMEAGFNGANCKSWEDNREQHGRRDAWMQASKLADTFMNEFEMVAQAAIANTENDEDEDDLGSE